MRNPTRIGEVPGGAELVSWFGSEPSFHDGKLLSFSVFGDGQAKLVATGFRMTNQTDESGYYILDRHFVATIDVAGLDRLTVSYDVEVSGPAAPAIISYLSVTPREGQDSFDVMLESIVGLNVDFGCQNIRVEFTASKDAS